MKVIRTLTVALIACAVTASADSIEQFLDVSVVGWYQGVTLAGNGIEHQRPAPIQIGTVNLVRALAIDRDTNFYTGRLVYKTALDGSTTNVVIRQAGKTNELDVTDAFTFNTVPPVPPVVNELANTNLSVTNFYQETGLRSLAFTTSSISFTNFGFCVGSALRTHKLTAIGTNGTPVSGFVSTLLYSNGVGLVTLNTNRFYFTNFQFAATNFVSGPAQIGFQTFAPFVSHN